MNNTFAFPSNGSMGEVVEVGMTLRDYFAAKAMQASLSDIDRVRSIKSYCENNNTNFSDEISFQAYDIADAMLKAR